MKRPDPDRRRAERTIGAEAHGKPLLRFLADRFRYLDRNGWAAAIAAGRLRINGRAAGPADRLRSGDRLVFEMDDLPEPPVRTDYRVLYRDAHLLAVEKPGNLPCHPGGRYFRHTLWHVLRHKEGIEKPRFLHRLDRETSGVVLVARSAEAARSGRALFQSGGVQKTYQVLVEGRFPPGTVLGDGWIMADGDSPVRKRRRFILRRDASAPPPAEERQECRTRFRRMTLSGPFSLLAVLPETGRLHQIRATLHALGFPVVGDKLYGIDETLFLRFISDGLTSGDWARLRLDRQALHSARLVMRHPITGHPLRIRSPLPTEMARLLGAAGVLS